MRVATYYGLFDSHGALDNLDLRSSSVCLSRKSCKLGRRGKGYDCQGSGQA